MASWRAIEHIASWLVLAAGTAVIYWYCSTPTETVRAQDGGFFFGSSQATNAVGTIVLLPKKDLLDRTVPTDTTWVGLTLSCGECTSGESLARLLQGTRSRILVVFHEQPDKVPGDLLIADEETWYVADPDGTLVPPSLLTLAPQWFTISQQGMVAQVIATQEELLVKLGGLPDEN